MRYPEASLPEITTPAAPPAASEVVANALESTVQNGALGDAIGFGGAGGFPANQGTPWSNQLSQTTTIFKNLRYYLISNFRQVLNEAYVELGLIQTITDVPVDDGLRGGVEIKSKQLDEDEIQELYATMDRQDDINTAGQAAKWNRLFGGAGIVVMTDQDPEEPLNVKAITSDSPLEFKAVDMWELFWDQQNVEGGLNLSADDTTFEFYSYYAINVHKSRVMPLKGLTAPSFIRPRLRGWGFSVVEALVRSINQYLKATDLGFEVLDEFKLDVYKIKNLVNTLLQPNGKQKVLERVQLANWQKNYQKAIVMDSEDDFDHKQLSFAGLGEAMAGIRMQVASDMRMPLTKLFGISAAGFNSGEDDIEVYNAMVESQVRSKLKYHLIRMVELRCQQLFGFIPDDIQLSFKPLRIMSADQEETVKTQIFNRVFQARSAGEITTFEFRESCNKGNLLPITLDTQGDELNPDDPEVAGLVAGETLSTEEDAAEGNVGANKPDSERPQLPKGAGPKSTLTTPKNPKEPKEPKVKNSLGYEVAAFQTDGGNDQFITEREPFLEKLSSVDPELWAQARARSAEAFGGENLKFAYWWYLRQGGKKI